MVLALILT